MGAYATWVAGGRELTPPQGVKWADVGGGSFRPRGQMDGWAGGADPPVGQMGG
jgi:hypothetical protein